MIIFFINQYWSSEKRLLNVIINKLFIHAFVLCSVPTIQTVKGRVVFFRKKRKKISALKPLTVWIFAVAISPPKTGNRILHNPAPLSSASF